MLKIRNSKHVLLGNLPDTIQPINKKSYEDTIHELTIKIDKDKFYNGTGEETEIAPYVYLINENIIEFNNDYYTIKNVEEVRDWGVGVVMSVTALHYANELSQFSIDGIWGYMPDVEELVIDNGNGTYDYTHIVPVNARTMLTDMLSKYAPSWQVGNIQVSDDIKRTIKIEWQSVLLGISTMKSLFNCLPNFRVTWNGTDWVKYVDLLLVQNAGLPTASLRYDRDIQHIQRNLDTNEIVTKMFVYGNEELSLNALDTNGLPIIGDIERTDNGVTYLTHEVGKTYIEDYSYFLNLGYTIEECRKYFTFTNRYVDKATIYSEDNTEFVANIQRLFDESVEALHEKATPKASYSMQIKDLYWHDQVNYSEIELGSTVRVYDSILGIDFVTTVISVVRDYASPIEDTDIVVENKTSEFKSLLQNVVGSLNTISRESIRRDTRYANSLMFNDNRGMIVYDENGNERVIAGQYELNKYGIKIIDGDITINKGQAKVKLNADDGIVILDSEGNPRFSVDTLGNVSIIGSFVIESGSKIVNAEGELEDIITQSTITTIENLVGAKATIYYGQDSVSQPTVDLIIGDMYVDLSSGLMWAYTDTGWTEIEDVQLTQALEDITTVETLANSKIRLFNAQPVAPYSIGDLWISSGELLTCIVGNIDGAFNPIHWEQQVTYTTEENIITKFSISDEGILIHGENVDIAGNVVFNGVKDVIDGVTVDDGFGQTVINGGMIKSKSITADQLEANTITTKLLNILSNVNLLHNNLDSFERESIVGKYTVDKDMFVTPELVLTESYQGANSLHISTTPKEDVQWMPYFDAQWVVFNDETLKVLVTPNNYYSLSCYVKSSGTLFAHLILITRFYRQDGTAIGTQNMEYIKHIFNTEFQRYSYPFQAPSDAYSVEIGVGVVSTEYPADVYIDGIQWEQITGITASTTPMAYGEPNHEPAQYSLTQIAPSGIYTWVKDVSLSYNEYEWKKQERYVTNREWKLQEDVNRNVAPYESQTGTCNVGYTFKLGMCYRNPDWQDVSPLQTQWSLTEPTASTGYRWVIKTTLYDWRDVTPQVLQWATTQPTGTTDIRWTQTAGIRTYYAYRKNKPINISASVIKPWEKTMNSAVTGEMIEEGILRSQDGKTIINLNDGTFSFADGFLTYNETDGLILDGNIDVKSGKIGNFFIDIDKWLSAKYEGFDARLSYLGLFLDEDNTYSSESHLALSSGLLSMQRPGQSMALTSNELMFYNDSLIGSYGDLTLEVGSIDFLYAKKGTSTKIIETSDGNTGDISTKYVKKDFNDLNDLDLELFLDTVKLKSYYNTYYDKQEISVIIEDEEDKNNPFSNILFDRQYQFVIYDDLPDFLREAMLEDNEICTEIMIGDKVKYSFNPKVINTKSFNGLTLASVQHVHNENKQLKSQISNLQDQINELKQLIQA